jgi:crossover junction endodeoxyribonuclease RusA
MEQIKFSVKGMPQPKGSARAFIPRGWTRPIITSDNPKNRPWASLVNVMAQYNAPKNGPHDGPIGLFLAFKLPKPKSYPKTREIPHIKKPDLDKLVRSVKDALKSVMYNDDSQVIQVTAKKEYGDAPGVEIEVIIMGTPRKEILKPCKKK